MKKMLCGAIMLLAVVAGFTNCKKDDGGAKVIESITLTPSSVKLIPGETQRISVKTNTGAKGTYTWESSVDSVASVSTNGTITAKKIGKTTITCTEANGAEAECIVTVTTYLRTIEFEEASVTVPRLIEGAKKEFTGLTITATGDSVWGYLAKTYVKIYSSGLYEGTEGLTGSDEGVIIYLPTYVYALPKNDNPNLGITVDTLWTFTDYQMQYYETKDTVANGKIAPSTLDAASCFTHIQSAFTAWNEEDVALFNEEYGKAIACFNNTVGYKMEYDAEDDGYYSSNLPISLITKVTDLVLTWTGNESSAYMYAIASGKMRLKELYGTDGWGVYYELNEDDEIELKSTKMEIGDEFLYKFKTISSAPTRRGATIDKVQNNNMPKFSGSNYVILNQKFVKK